MKRNIYILFAISLLIRMLVVGGSFSLYGDGMIVLFDGNE